jgi:hypothetical protein
VTSSYIASPKNQKRLAEPFATGHCLSWDGRTNACEGKQPTIFPPANGLARANERFEDQSVKYFTKSSTCHLDDRKHEEIMGHPQFESARHAMEGCFILSGPPTPAAAGE